MKTPGQEVKRELTLAETFMGCSGCQEVNCNTASRGSCCLKRQQVASREERVIADLSTNPRRLNVAC